MRCISTLMRHHSPINISTYLDTHERPSNNPGRPSVSLGSVFAEHIKRNQDRFYSQHFLKSSSHLTSICEVCSLVNFISQLRSSFSKSSGPALTESSLQNKIEKIHKTESFFLVAEAFIRSKIPFGTTCQDNLRSF